MTSNIVWQHGHLSLTARRKLLGTESGNKVLWFTGLSGSGKSTIAAALERELHALGIPSYVLDGDNVRHGLSADLGFSESDKKENLRRVAEVARLFYDAGLFVLVCMISPRRTARAYARRLIGKDFLEIFVDCPLGECEQRDVKGLYRKARQGDIPDFIGIHTAYQKPVNPEIHLDTARETVPDCVEMILRHLKIRTSGRIARKRGN
jgi:adenylylsulfate kinase